MTKITFVSITLLIAMLISIMCIAIYWRSIKQNDTENTKDIKIICKD